MIDPPVVGVVMGSRSDWETMERACIALDAVGVVYETRIVSAHRTPKLLVEYAETARERLAATGSVRAALVTSADRDAAGAR